MPKSVDSLKKMILLNRMYERNIEDVPSRSSLLKSKAILLNNISLRKYYSTKNNNSLVPVKKYENADFSKKQAVL